VTKVALINPGVKKVLGTKKLQSIVGIPKTPLGLCFLASYLEKYGIDVCILDQMAGQNVEKRLLEEKPDVVGVTAMTMFAQEAYRLAEFAKENLDCLTVMGGIHASSLPEEAKEHVDIVVVGEGEKILLNIAQKSKDIKPGIVQGEMLQNINEIPLPARHLVDMDFYLSQKETITGIGIVAESVLTSRGCPYRCIFCANSKRRVPIRYRNLDSIVEELKMLKDNYKVKGIAFVDECFSANRQRLVEICKEIKKLDLIWDVQTRSNLIDEEMIRLMKDSGCVQVGIGFESGSQRILNIMKKGTTVEQNKKAVEICKKVGMKVRGCFIVGSPTETKEDIEMTRKFIDENGVDYVTFFLMTPFPGSELWDYCKENNLIPKNFDWSTFTTGPQAIPFACNTIPMDELKRIHNELDLRYSIRNYTFAQLMKRGLKNPVPVASTIKKFIKNKLVK